MNKEELSSYKKAHHAQQKAQGFKRVNVTLTPEEFRALEHDAKAHGQRTTTHFKACAIAYIENEPIIPPYLEERLDSLLHVLRGIGNNLNQLARYSNEMRYFLDHEEVRLQLRRLDEEITTFVRKPFEPKCSKVDENNRI